MMSELPTGGPGFDWGHQQIADVEEAVGRADPKMLSEASISIMASHLLMSVRKGKGMTLEEVAGVRGVTRSAVHQAESRQFADLKIGSVLDHLVAVGYDVDEQWLTETLARALLTGASS